MTNLRYQLGLLAILAVAISAAAQAGSPDLATIVDRMTQAQLDAHNSIRPYEVTREYKFFQGVEDDSPDSHVVADVTFFTTCWPRPPPVALTIENCLESGGK